MWSSSGKNGIKGVMISCMKWNRMALNVLEGSERNQSSVFLWFIVFVLGALCVSVTREGVRKLTFTSIINVIIQLLNNNNELTPWNSFSSEWNSFHQLLLEQTPQFTSIMNLFLSQTKLKHFRVHSLFMLLFVFVFLIIRVRVTSRESG